MKVSSSGGNISSGAKYSSSGSASRSTGGSSDAELTEFSQVAGKRLRPPSCNNLNQISYRIHGYLTFIYFYGD